MYPLRPRSSPKATIFFIFLIWISAFIVGLPGLVAAELFDQKTVNFTKVHNDTGLQVTQEISELEVKVTMKLHCSFNLSPELLELYDYALFILMYLLPLTTLAATYVPISIRLWRHREIGEITRAQAESIRSKRRAVKMMCVVMSIFAVCWLPYQLFFIIIRIKPSVQAYKHLPKIFVSCYWLAMSNAIYNPIIYFTMNRR
ncbi:Tachykinin peptides receptor 99D [Paragonimus heterotremus]|uniref:Tachykinin peptides receptor 99D n=1 Tax=Paragonimus heterotremus TaxID=100268 RepID=A0A8J4X3H4_9TREM|nr:Tachykinin peptides receptor 99D [Paragonimus heterotremus]